MPDSCRTQSFQHYNSDRFSPDQCLFLVRQRPRWAECSPSSLRSLFGQDSDLRSLSHVLMNDWVTLGPSELSVWLRCPLPSKFCHLNVLDKCKTIVNLLLKLVGKFSFADLVMTQVMCTRRNIHRNAVITIVLRFLLPLL